MNTAAFLFVSSVLLVSFQAALGLECYECNSGEDPNCALENFGKSDYVKECEEVEDKCMKLVTQQFIMKDGKPTEGISLVTRYCGSEDFVGCKTSQGAGSEQIQCACEKNMCNSAPYTIPRPLSVLALVAIVALFWH